MPEPRQPHHNNNNNNNYYYYYEYYYNHNSIYSLSTCSLHNHVCSTS